MDIADGLLRWYVSQVVEPVFGSVDDAPDDLRAYHPYIENARRLAHQAGELDALRLALDYVLAHPAISTTRIVQPSFLYDEAELRVVLAEMRAVIWPAVPPPPLEALEQLRLVEMDLNNWRRNRM